MQQDRAAALVSGGFEVVLVVQNNRVQHVNTVLLFALLQLQRLEHLQNRKSLVTSRLPQPVSYVTTSCTCSTSCVSAASTFSRIID